MAHTTGIARGRHVDASYAQRRIQLACLAIGGIAGAFLTLYVFWILGW